MQHKYPTERRDVTSRKGGFTRAKNGRRVQFKNSQPRFWSFLNIHVAVHLQKIMGQEDKQQHPCHQPISQKGTKQ